MFRLRCGNRNTPMACCIRTDVIPEDERDLTNYSNYLDSSTRGCYCATYRMAPICTKPDAEPRKCEFEIKLWKKLLFIFFGGLIAMTIALPIIYIKPCENRCLIGGGCYTDKQICDGIDHCTERDDEKHCKPKIKRIPDVVTGLIDRDVSVHCDVIMGDESQVLEWYSTPYSGDDDITLWNSDRSRSYQQGFNVYYTEGRKTCDLKIWSVQPSQINDTFSVHFKSGSQNNRVQLIVAENFSCDSLTSGVEISEGDSVTHTATVVYYGTIEPEVVWYLDKEEQQYEESTVQLGDVNIKTVTYTTIVSEGFNGKPIEAHLLTDIGHTKYTDSNYADKCATFYNMFTSVSDVHLDYENQQADENYDDLLLGPNSVLTCTAQGYPVPGYTWKCNDGAYIIFGRWLTVPSGAPVDMKCECTASNIVNSITRSSSENVRFVTYNGANSRSVDVNVCVFLLLLTTSKLWNY